MFRICFLILCVTISTTVITLGIKYLFPNKDMFYWQISISMFVTVILLRWFNRIER